MKDFSFAIQISPEKRVSAHHCKETGGLVVLRWVTNGKQTSVGLTPEATTATHKLLGDLIKLRKREARKILKGKQP